MTAPLRMAGVFDATDAEGPYFSADRRRVLDPAERESLARYLETAPMVLRASGFETDPLDPGAGEVVPLSYRTDGVWVWQEASAYYLRARGCAPDDDLVAHIAAAGYRPPASVPDDVRDAASDMAMTADPPEQLTGRRAAQYFAIVDHPRYPATAPAGLLRQWRTDEGVRRDQVLPRSMRWEHTGAFVQNARSGEDDFEEIPSRVAARIADDWWAQWRPDQPGS
ncbi:hypothetical protein Dvina_30915 [Dactylosporangium vinaceum]|uniref:Uncharacterized protein n=1 Tax=Dactylosporangium vinaceum TaxID=53362 RepID=A0ABV5MJX8_9ACTN|nr:hypothetical protein [Dactylosporangium vinaceum]UAB92729.1 hypothetical protein Dvina_30915 [Dactylosporangium vinaceum]